MAYKTTKEWQNEYNLDLGLSILKGATTGMSLGSTMGPIGSAIGVVVGGTAGLLGSIFTGNKTAVNNFIDQEKLKRKDATTTRNSYIYRVQDEINKTKATFDTTYGAGLFNQYDSMFMQILDLQPSDSLNTLLSNMQMDKVSGEITTRINGKVGEKLLTSALSITDINTEYLEYLKEQLRAQDTSFGLEMQNLATQERMAMKQYLNDMDAIRLQYAQQFENTFMQTRAENVQAESNLGEASLAQATSGIRQEGSGLNQTTMVQFQNDIAKVARASALKYQMKMYGYELNTKTNSFVLDSHSLRNQIKSSTMTSLGKLIDSYNQQNASNKKYYEGIADAELAIDEYNKGIKEADEGRTGWFNSQNKKDHIYKETMESYFG